MSQFFNARSDFAHPENKALYARDYLTNNKYQLQQHYLNYHATKEEREKEFKYYCKCCDYGTYSKDFIEKHNNTNKHKLQSN